MFSQSCTIEAICLVVCIYSSVYAEESITSTWNFKAHGSTLCRSTANGQLPWPIGDGGWLAQELRPFCHNLTISSANINPACPEL